jgi:hypothetical protein
MTLAMFISALERLLHRAGRVKNCLVRQNGMGWISGRCEIVACPTSNTTQAELNIANAKCRFNERRGQAVDNG